jgi:hypothetical protein
MQKQLKGNRMPNYKTKKGSIKTVKPISKAGQKLLGMKNVKKKASGGKAKKHAKSAFKTVKKYGTKAAKSGALGPIAVGIAAMPEGAKALKGIYDRLPEPKGYPKRKAPKPGSLGGKAKAVKKKPVTKAFMGLLTSSPALKFLKDKGIMSGGALGLAAKALKKKKKGSAAPAAAAAAPKIMDKKNPMGDPGQFAPATPMTMSKGGSMKRKRPIDGIAQRGKTRAR